MTLPRRALGIFLQGAGILLLGLALAELALQGAALLAGNRGTAWRKSAAHKILCIGDSHTYGALVPAAESYPGHLQRLHDEHEPGAYSVVNLPAVLNKLKWQLSERGGHALLCILAHIDAGDELHNRR